MILLKDRPQYLLGQITELDEEPSILIEKCYEVLGDEEITPFPKYTDQRDLFLTSDQIFTILEPSSKLVGIYKSK